MAHVSLRSRVAVAKAGCSARTWLQKRVPQPKTLNRLGFRVWGLGFRLWGLGFRVWGLGFGVWGLGFTALTRFAKRGNLWIS